MAKQRPCIVCGRPIPKRTDRLYFRDPRPFRPAEARSYGGEYPAQEAKPDGMREGETIYLASKPKTRAEAQRYVNGEIISASRGSNGLAHVNYWDGESFADRYFCTNHCAMKQGYASAQHGDRFRWKGNDEK